MWSEFPEDAEFGEPFPCDFNECGRDAFHAYIGEGGDLFLCSIHYQPSSPLSGGSLGEETS